MRKSTPRRVLTLCAALTLLTLTGCNAERDPVATTPEVAESWSAEDEAQAIEEAEQAIRDYWKVSAQCLADPPNADQSCFDEVSYGDQLISDRTALKDAQDYDASYVGEVTYVRTDRVISVDLSIGPDKEIRLSVCTEASDFDILWSDGRSIWPTDAPKRSRSVYVVRKHTSEWQIADIAEDPEGREC